MKLRILWVKVSERRRALATAGRHLVQDQYSWRQVTQQFEMLCEHVVEHHAR